MSKQTSLGGDITYDLSLLAQSAHRWSSSAGLRIVYHDFFRRMQEAAFVGPSLEVGSGIGSLKEVVADVVTSDIAKTDYVELEVSAYCIKKTGMTWATIYAMDVLHHLKAPFEFFKSVAESLKPAGRLVLLEPAATISGKVFYKLFHHEPIEARAINSPYVFVEDNMKGGFANMAMAWVLFSRDRQKVAKDLEKIGLKIAVLDFFSGISYPLTGGFSKKQYASDRCLKWVLRLEKRLPRYFWRFAGLRMLIVLEKTSSS